MNTSQEEHPIHVFYAITHIKWEALLKRADMLNCKYIATGHYARMKVNGRYVIYKELMK